MNTIIKILLQSELQSIYELDMKEEIDIKEEAKRLVPDVTSKKPQFPKMATKLIIEYGLSE